MTPKEVLREAAKLIEKGWCQGRYAMSESGQGLPYDNFEATRFCAVGAIARVSMLDGSSKFNKIKNLIREIVGGCVEEWNDNPSTTKEMVLEVFRKAAE